jgi:curved DNA-binding protein CbpA
MEAGAEPMVTEGHAVHVKERVDLQAIESILDAEGIDDLVSRPPAEAGALYALLLECARGEAGECFEAICQVAERRRVTPAYLIDRADVLVESAEARQAGDLYRILGVPSLATAGEIRARWREVVKECHPDLAGSGSSERFRAIKAAYNVLGDPERRAEYQRVWRDTIEHIALARAIADTVEIEQMPELGQRASRVIRALAARVGGFMRGPEEASESASMGEGDYGEPAREAQEEPSAMTKTKEEQLGKRSEPPVKRELRAEEPTGLKEDEMQDVLRRTEAMFEAVRGIDQRLAGAGFEGVSAIARLFEQLHTALDAVSIDEIDSTIADVERARQSLDTVGGDLARLRRLKLSLGDGAHDGR